MKLDTFFAMASPATLASLIADYCASAQNNIEWQKLTTCAKMELANIVGTVEAETMIDNACKAWKYHTTKGE